MMSRSHARIYLARWVVLSLLTIAILAVATNRSFAAEVKEVRSPSGLTAWLIEDNSLPMVSVRVTFRQSGYAYDPEGREGLYAMLAPLMLEGAGKLDALAFQEALEDRAIQLGSNAGADETTFEMKTLSEHREEAFRLLGLALNYPRFDVNAIERKRRQMLSLLDQLQASPEYLAEKAWRKIAFPVHDYGLTGKGTPESLKAITRNDLMQTARERFTRNRLVISVAGDITASELAALLDAHLAVLPEGDQRGERLGQTRPVQPGQVETVSLDLPQSNVVAGFRGPARSHDDFMPAFVLMDIVGGGGLTSQLAEEVREKRGLVYSIGGYLQPMDFAALIKFSFASGNASVGEALQTFIGVLEKAAKGGITQEELENSKRYLAGSFPLQIDSLDNLADYLNMMQLNSLGKDYLNRRNALIEAVTLEDIHRVAKRYFKPENLLVTVVGKPEGNVNSLLPQGKQ
jgi:zinc protease